MAAVILAFHAAVVLVVFYAAFEDLRHMRIRNEVCALVLALFMPYFFLLPLHDALMHLAAAGVVLAAGALMFFARMLGGGDAKLLAAVALWPKFAGLPQFLIVMTLAGGALALAAIALRRSGVLPKIQASHPAVYGPEDGWLASLGRGETVVPYGIAIAIATALTLF